MKSVLSTTLTLIYLTSCSTQQESEVTQITNNQQIQLTEFQQTCVTRLDSEEKSWFNKFQEGTWLAKGWQEISLELVERTPFNEKELVEKNMSNLGILIGCEWSRDNDVRKIDTEQIKRWGRNLETITPSEINKTILDIYHQARELVQ